MASLHITKLEDDIIERLRIRATEHQVSMEEEARRILKKAVAPQRNIGDLAQEYFGLENGVDLALPERTPHEPLGFSKELPCHVESITLAIQLFKDGNVSVNKAAKLAKMDLASFIELVSDQGIPIVDFTVEEFDKEMAYLNS